MAYSYQDDSTYFAQVAEDLQELAEQELATLGATDLRPGFRGLYFTASLRTIYSINLHARLVNRVLAPIKFFNCHSDKYLYQQALKIEWADFLTPDHTFAVFANVSNSAIRHSKFAALRLKDAIADYFRTQFGVRPSVDTREPDLWVNLHIARNRATISLDTSGGSLHRRGYRVSAVEAPMVETLAAAIIKQSGWDGSQPMYDPFCGSGTLLCEGYIHASNQPAAMLRKKFGFERLPDFDKSLWREVRGESLKNKVPLKRGIISGSDISLAAVEAARTNCSAIDADRAIEIKQKDIFDVQKIEGQAIFCNPPYGIRMRKGEDLSLFYKRFGDFLKQRCCGSSAYIYFGERKYLKNIGLRSSWKVPLSNGGLDGRLAKFELY